MKPRIGLIAIALALASCDRVERPSLTNVPGPEFARPAGSPYTKTELGAGQALAINHSGHVVGETCVPGCGYRGFFWASGGSVDTLGVLPGYNNSTARGINDLDQVVGRVYCGSPCTLPGRPALWTRSGSTWVVNELPTGGFTTGSASDVNNAGRIAGTVTLGLYMSDAPVVWTSMGASPTVLPLTPDRISGTTRAINNLGMVAGEASVGNYFRQAVVWYPNGSEWVALTLPGLIVEEDSVASVVATDIGERGAQGPVFVAGYARASDGRYRAVRWTLTEGAPGDWQVYGPQELETPGRAITGYGRGVNTAGETVGSAPDAKGGWYVAVRWAPSGAGENLPGGPTSSSSLAYDVNDTGSIVGQSNGKAVVWQK